VEQEHDASDSPATRVNSSLESNAYPRNLSYALIPLCLKAADHFVLRPHSGMFSGLVAVCLKASLQYVSRERLSLIEDLMGVCF